MQRYFSEHTFLCTFDNGDGGAHPSSDRLRGSLGGWEGMFNASPETARRLIKLGGKDARKVLAEAGMAK